MPERHPEHVLIVDDDYAIRNYYGKLLQRQNYRVSAAVNARDAQALIAADCPDLVILDHYLPDSSGEQLLRELRGQARTRQLPVIFLSVDDSAARFRAVMNLGADDYLTKPAEARELTEAVATQLHKHRRRTGKHGAARSGAAPEAAALPGVPPAYRVSGTLGMGGTATAYLARCAAHPGDCVVKTIHLAGDLNPDIAERFSREGELLARVVHPNVVRVYEYGYAHGDPRGEPGGHAYLAMEYIAGGSLKQMLGSPWEPAEALRLMHKVAQGLGAVHAAGVIHRDLKPDNIMLRANSLEPVLLDFGAAKDLLDDHQHTLAGTVIGTPSYMAPEVIAGQPAAPATDVYACGAMLYELLTGARPYAATNMTALLHQHLTYPIPRLPSRQAIFQPLLERLLAKSPLDRPRDGAALAEEIGTLWNQLTGAVLTPPPGAVPASPTGAVLAPPAGAVPAPPARAYLGATAHPTAPPETHVMSPSDPAADRNADPAADAANPIGNPIADPTADPTGERLGITGRIAQLHESYRSSFNSEFDPQAFRKDDFYAFQVLEKAIRDGSSDLKEVARALEQARLAMMDGGESIGIDIDVGAADPAAFAAFADPAPTAEAGPVVPAAEASAATPAGAADATAGPDPTAGASAAAALAAKLERRKRAVAGGAGHVRLGNREIMLLSQMRVRYRKVFGMFFDTFDFTGNDLYARTLLTLCVASDDPVLAGMAQHFLNEDGTPRFHRRKGAADLDLATAA